MACPCRRSSARTGPKARSTPRSRWPRRRAAPATRSPFRRSSSNPMAILERTIDELSQALSRRELKAIDLCEASLARIHATRNLNSFLAIDEAGARQTAAESDQRIARGEARSPLEGIPIAL